MSTTITGNHTVAITLNPATPDVLVTGTIDAKTHLTKYVFHRGSYISTFQVSGALYAPKTGRFSIQNDGVIETSMSVTGSATFDAGVVLKAGDEFVNAGTVAGRTGILMLGAPGSYVKNESIIDATYAGIELLGRGLVVNTGIINAPGAFGIIATGGTIVNAGQIYGGVFDVNRPIITGSHTFANLATIENSGFVDGVIEVADGRIVNSGFARQLAINSGVMINTGIVRNTGSIAVLSNSAAFYNYGQIISQGTGVAGHGPVYNYGHILSGTGIDMAGATVSTYAYNSGNIDGTAGAGISFQSLGTLINKGNVQGTSEGVTLAKGGDVINRGQITGGTGVYFHTRTLAALDNTGTIFGTAGPGVDFYIYYALGVSVRNTGVIEGVSDGIDVRGLGARDTAYLFNSGKIEASGTAADGIRMQAYGTLVNRGKIESQGIGVWLYDQSTVTNTGTITGATGIENLSGYGSTIFNGGLITGTGIGGAGVSLLVKATLSNTGTIMAANGTGILLADGGTTTDSGTIIGGTTGIYVSDGGNIDVSGLLKGSTYALKFNPDLEFPLTNRLTLTPGAVLSGAVNGGGGVLELAAGGSKNGQIASNVTNFSEIIVDPTARWNIPAQAATALVENNGVLVAANGTQTISNLQGTGIIALAGGDLSLPGAVQSSQTIAFAATNETLAIGSASAFGATLTQFATSDVINLTNIAFTSVTSLSFDAGTLSIFESSTALTIAFGTESFAGEAFIAFADIAGTGIILRSTAAMSFLTPASTTSAPDLPSLQPVYTAARQTPAIAAAATAAQNGWVTHELLTTIQAGAALVTLHA